MDIMKKIIVADVIKQEKNADPSNTIDCAFAVLRKPMVSEWDLCTGPDPRPQPRFLQIATSWNNEMRVVNFRDVYSDRDRPVHGKINI